MSLILHYHPLASFCWKVLIGLYENETPFEPVIIDLGEDSLKYVDLNAEVLATN